MNDDVKSILGGAACEALAALGLTTLAQLQGVLAVPSLRPNLVIALGVSEAQLDALATALATVGFDPAAVPPMPRPPSGVAIPSDHPAPPEDGNDGF